MKTIFDKYKQAGSKIKYSTGLGLAFCKIAVEKHGGKIVIKSNKNKGTVVCFTLPIAEIEETKQTEITPKLEIVLTKTERESLLEIQPELENIDISEITTFRKIFKTIEEQNLGNKSWREALKKSVYAGNEVGFQNLISKINK